MAILTLAGEHGSGYTKIGKAVAERLGYEYVDRQRMLDDLGEAGEQWEKRGKEYDLHCPTVWERFDWSFMAFKALMQHVYLEHASRDKVVLMGLGGNFLLRGVPFALNVRITAPKEARADRIAAWEEVDLKTAEWLRDKADHDDSCYVRALYGKSWDPTAYDASFDSGIQTQADIVEAIVAMIAEKDKLDMPEARKGLQSLTLAAKVKAQIISDKQFFVPTLEVFPSSDGLVVQGVVHNPEEKERLEERVRAMTPGERVTFRLHYRG
jgi:cytidylate kinase